MGFRIALCTVSVKARLLVFLQCVNEVFHAAIHCAADRFRLDGIMDDIGISVFPFRFFVWLEACNLHRSSHEIVAHESQIPMKQSWQFSLPSCPSGITTIFTTPRKPAERCSSRRVWLKTHATFWSIWFDTARTCIKMPICSD